MSETPKKLVIIDGKSVFYRGYYAMPSLSTKDGTPTGGVYGFAVLALQVLKKLAPDYVIVAWDKPKTNIRSRRNLYPLYKANRKPMPQDLRDQVPVLREMMSAFNWPLLEVDDFEADDIMATLTRQASKAGLRTVLVTSDLDVLQAVDDDTDVCLLKKGLTNIVMYDRESFTKEYNMTPDQFIDYKALKGDSSDNVPGVGGVGDKTARDLIQKFGSLEGVYQHLEEIPATLKTKLEKDKEMAFLSHKLLEIRFDAPVKLNLKASETEDARPKEIASMFYALEFKRLLNDLPAYMQVVAAEEEQKQTVQDLGKGVKVSIDPAANVLSDSLKSAKELVIYSVSTPGEGLVSLLVSPADSQAFVLNSISPEVKKILQPILENAGVNKIGYNLKLDIKAWLEHGIDIQPIGHDVLIGLFLINSLNRSQLLSELVQDEMGNDLPQLDTVSPETLESVAAPLTKALWGLYKKQTNELSGLTKVKKLAEDIEWPIIPVLAHMEYEGIKLDSAYLGEMSSRFAKRINGIQKLIFKEAGQEFNISSPQQLQMILFEKLQLPTQGIKRNKTGYSTGAPELEKLKPLHPIINMITEYREYTKLQSTYVEALPKLVDKNSRLHTTFAQNVAPTGRLSSVNPNLQNIPIRTEVGREIRRAFVAGKGNVLISADYSQFELRLAAILSEDKTMIEAFNKGIDIHAQTASEVLGIPMEAVDKGQRRDAKVVNFGVMYGLGAHGLSVATGMTHEDAKSFIERYFSVRKKLLAYIERLREQAKNDGYTETMFGRRRPTPDVNSSNFMVREAAMRQAVNLPFQGSAADIIKLAMIELDKKLGNAKMLLQIHDSLLVETPETEAEKTAKLLQDVMENVVKLPVKLEVDTTIGKTWSDL